MATTGQSSSLRLSVSRYSEIIIPISIFLSLFSTLGLLRSEFLISITDTEYLGLPRITFQNIGEIFTNPPFQPWYRPLDVITVSLEQGLFGDNFTPMMFIQAVIPAATAVVIYFLALEVSRGRRVVAISASILYPLTLGVIETTWLFMHKVILSDFFVIFGMLCYVRYTKEGHLKWFLLLWASALMAPWIRELGGVLSVVVLFTALMERRRDLKLLLSIPVFVFHAIYSSFFPALVILHKIELISIFQRATSGLYNSGVFSNSPVVLNLDNPFRVSLYYPPLLTIALFVSVALFLFLKRNVVNRIGAFLVICILGLSLFSIYFPYMPVVPATAPFLFIIVVVCAGFKFGKLLPIWFTVPIVPFMFIPVHDAWLKMAAVPFVITSFLWIDYVFKLRPVDKIIERLSSIIVVVKERRPNFSQTSSIMIILLIVLLVFTLPNVVNAYSSFKNNISTEQKIGKWFNDNVPDGSAVISNLRQNWDFQYYSKDHVKAFLLDFRLTYPLPGGRGLTLNDLSNNMSQGQEFPGYYFIIADKFGKPGFPPIDESLLKKAASFTSNCSYPITDPLQFALPEHYWRFGGPTDLRHEYSSIITPFHGECTASFSIYKFTGGAADLRKAIDHLPPQFTNNNPAVWENDYKGYRIVVFKDKYYAIPSNFGIYEKRIFREKGYLIQGPDVTKIQAAITKVPDSPTILTLIDSFKHYNILALYGKYYAIPQGEGTFDLKRIQTHNYTSSFTGDTLEQVKLLIDGQSQDLVGSYRGYNVISYNGHYYAIPISDGNFSIARINSGGYSSSFVADSLDDMHSKIILPHFIGTYHGFNIILYNLKYYAISQSNGQFDLTKLQNNSYNPIFNGTTVNDIENQIDKTSGVHS